MAILYIEKLGGLANIGGTQSHIRSRGQLRTEVLTEKELQSVESLFASKSESETPAVADGFRFRISRTTAAGTETVEVPESRVPAALASSVKDELV